MANFEPLLKAIHSGATVTQNTVSGKYETRFASGSNVKSIQPTAEKAWEYGYYVAKNSTTSPVPLKDDNEGLRDAGSIIAWELRECSILEVTLDANYTLQNPNELKAGTYILFVRQDATGGHTLTLEDDYKSPDASGITISSAANAIDIITFVVPASEDAMYYVGTQNFG